LNEELTVIRADKGPNPLGLSREVGLGTTIVELYRRDGILEEAESFHRRTLSDLGCILSECHSIVVEQKVRLADILNCLGHFIEAEELMLKAMNITLILPSTSMMKQRRVLKETYTHLNRWEEVTKSLPRSEHTGSGSVIVIVWDIIRPVQS
jgi:hypothetical protein